MLFKKSLFFKSNEILLYNVTYKLYYNVTQIGEFLWIKIQNLQPK